MVGQGQQHRRRDKQKSLDSSLRGSRSMPAEDRCLLFAQDFKRLLT
jgi:hypothetical protein